MELFIDNKSGAPIYEQICEQVRAQIVSGALKEDEPLPSIRALAKDLRISVITTKRAYDELLQAGYVYAVAGKGYFVAPRNVELLREENLRRIEAHLTEVAKLAASCDLTREGRFQHLRRPLRGGDRMNAVELTDLTKHYGDFTLDRVSLTLPEGCVMGLVGENGAGKTTVIKLLLGMLKRDGGAVRVLGRDMDTDGRAVKEELGVVLDETGFPECVTARQAGRIMARRLSELGCARLR